MQKEMVDKAYGIAKAKEHQTQRPSAHGNPGCAPAVFSRERGRCARGPYRRRPLAGGFERRESERGDSAQCEPGGNGSAQSEIAGRGPFRREFAKSEPDHAGMAGTS